MPRDIFSFASQAELIIEYQLQDGPIGPSWMALWTDRPRINQRRRASKQWPAIYE